MEMDKERKARLEKIVATERLRLAMETDEERKKKNRLEKMAAQAGQEDRRARLEHMSDKYHFNKRCYHFIVCWNNSLF